MSTSLSLASRALARVERGLPLFKLRTRALLGLWSKTELTLAVSGHAADLLMGGRPTEASALLEAYARLDSASYGNREKLRMRLVGIQRGVAAESGAEFVQALGISLFGSGRPQDAIAAFEADTTVEPSDYPNHELLRRKLLARMESLNLTTRIQYVTAYSGALLEAHAPKQALAVVGGELGACLLSRDVQATEKLLTGRFQVLDAFERTQYAVAIFVSLIALDRNHEVGDLRRIWVGFDMGASPTTSAILTACEGMERQVDPLFFMALGLSFSGSLNSQHGFVECLQFALGVDLDELHSDSYRCAWAHNLLGSDFSFYRIALAWLLIVFLCVDQKFDSASCLLLAMAEAACGAPNSFRALGVQLSRPSQLMSAPARERLAGFAIGSLVKSDHCLSAVELAEGFIGLDRESYDSPEVLDSTISRYSSEPEWQTSSSLFWYLLFALKEAGELRKLCQILPVIRRAAFSAALLRERDGFWGLLVVRVHSYAFDLCSERDPRANLQRCEELVRILRGDILQRGFRLGDRSSILEGTRVERRNLLSTALRAAWDLMELSDVSAALLDYLLWDAELAQRLLLERFILEPISSVSPGELPKSGWPWLGVPMEPSTEDHLPEQLPGHPVGRFLEESAVGPQRELLLESKVEAPAWQETRDLMRRARQLISEGIDEAKLARAIGPAAMLIRATFDPDGALHWIAAKSDGRRVRVLDWQAGQSGDLFRLRWIVASHDVRMALLRLRARLCRSLFADRVKEILRGISAKFRRLETALEEAAPGDALSTAAEQISAGLRPVEDGRPTDQEALLAPILSLLRWKPPPAAYATWAAKTRAEVATLRSLVEGEHGGALSQTRFDRCTESFLEEIGVLWNLDRLAAELSPNLDLVFQLDDALHAVPVAHLIVGGRPLFQQVASTRSSLSLMMSAVQIEAERVVEADQGPDCLLSVSHFGFGDAARDGAAWLHHGFSRLAKEHGLECLGAADDPRGSAGTLRSALETRKHFVVVAICGHGDFYRSGVRLAADGENGSVSESVLWDGGGCDLSYVDWLWLVSCSIGRLSQNGDRDVEGFCVRLALHRARSVAAYRWPVDSVESVALTNESVRLYLEALKSPEPGTAECLRARALNQARRRFLGDGTHAPSVDRRVGLNTAAACELFGLG